MVLRNMSCPFVYDTGFLPIMLVIILAMVPLASTGPIRRATRMQVKDLLRYELGRKESRLTNRWVIR